MHSLLVKLLSAAMLIAATAARAQVALVTELEGAATIGSGAQRSTLALLASLQPGDVLALERGARLVAAFPSSGAVFEASGPARLRVGAESIEADGASLQRRDYAAALRELRVRPVAAVQASVVMRGGHSFGLRAIAPIGVLRAHEANRLQWRIDEAAADARVSVRLIDVEGAVVFAAESSETALSLPAGLTLQRQQPYVWTVRGTDQLGRRIESAAEFMLLTDAQARALDALAERAPHDATARVLHDLALRQIAADAQIAQVAGGWRGR